MLSIMSTENIWATAKKKVRVDGMFSATVSFGLLRRYVTLMKKMEEGVREQGGGVLPVKFQGLLELPDPCGRRHLQAAGPTLSPLIPPARISPRCEFMGFGMEAVHFLPASDARAAHALQLLRLL